MTVMIKIGKRMENKRKISFEFEKPTGKEIFENLIKALEEGTLKFPPSFDEKWTNYVMEFFKNLGHDRSYRVRVKGEEGEILTIDCSWLIDLPTLSTIDLAMEHEDSSRLVSILPEIRKLGHVKANLKIAIYYPPTDRILSDLKRIVKEIEAQGIKLPKEKWLVITISGEKEEIIFRGYEFGHEGKYNQIGERSFSYEQVYEKAPEKGTEDRKEAE